MKGWLDDAIRYEKGNDRYVPAEWRGEAGDRRLPPRPGAAACLAVALPCRGPLGRGQARVCRRKGELTSKSGIGDKDSYHLCDFAAPTRGARRAPSPARLAAHLAARQREGQPPQLERGEPHGQPHPGAAEPGQLDHTARADPVTIGRHDPAIDGGKQTKKKFEHGGEDQSAERPAVEALFRRRRGGSACGIFAAAADRRSGRRPRSRRRIDRAPRSLHGCDSPVSILNFFVTIASTRTHFEPRVFHPMVLADEFALWIHRRFF
ncbi:hypothetical protein CG017_05819 (plasmid) [Burkholderia glumae]|nr:hypothetical protein CG017_05819 [Burkholderia glumae]